MGERRWRAAQAVGREHIPAIVRDTRDDAMLRDALLENIHRANLNPLEEAAAYQQLLEEFGATHEELARRIGRSRPQISNTIRLLNLPAQVQRRVAAGVLSAGHARALLSLDDAEAQETARHADRRRRAVGSGDRGDWWPWPSPMGRRRQAAEAAAEAARPGADRSGRPAVGPLRHPGEGGHRPEQGQDHHRVRHGRRPGADRRHHRSAAGGGAGGLTPPVRLRPRYPTGGAAVLHPGVVAVSRETQGGPDAEVGMICGPSSSSSSPSQPGVSLWPQEKSAGVVGAECGRPVAAAGTFEGTSRPRARVGAPRGGPRAVGGRRASRGGPRAVGAAMRWRPADATATGEAMGDGPGGLGG